jgi:hypothetical protein
MPRKQYTVADTLLQRPRHPKDIGFSGEGEDINN